MARLPTKANLSAPASMRSGRTIASFDTTALGRGIASAGADIASLGEDIERRQNAVDLARAEAYKTEQFLKTQNEFEQDPEYQTFSERAPKKTREIVQNGAHIIRDPVMRERWEAGAMGDAARVNDTIVDHGRKLQTQAETVAFDESLEANRRIYVDPSTNEEAKERARADIEGAIAAGLESGLLTPEQADARRQTYLEDADYNRGLLEAERDPASISRPLPAEVSDRASDAMSFFMSQGWSKAQAAGIVGNLIGESNLDPDARNPGDGQDGTDSIGLGQWNSARARALKAYAGERGLDWRDYGVQLAFVQHELETSESGAAEALKNAENIDEATAAFVGYERPQGWSSSNPRGAHNYEGRLKFAGMAAGEEVNPEYFNRMSPEQRQTVFDTAASRAAELRRISEAQKKADYTAYKDSFELDILTGGVRSENTILNNEVLRDGDKASLLRTFRTQMDEAIATSQAMTAFGNGALRVDPFDTQGKKTVDNVYSESLKAVPEEQVQPLTEELVRQTGVVPKGALNLIRRGMESTDASVVTQAAQAAQRISSINPAALSRRDGGQQVQDFADDFSHYVNNLNLPPDEAARRIMEARDPDKRRDRKALEPAAKEFVKGLEDADVAAFFDEDFNPFSEPDLGFTPAQELGIKADYMAIAEEAFFAANGDPELAKNRAKETMKRLYGVTEMTGRRVVMKHPPERYWPKMKRFAGDDPNLEYAMLQLRDDVSQLAGREPGGQPIDMESIQLVTTPATDAAIKRGEVPGYAVMWKDDNGVWQSLPGQLWHPDPEGARTADIEATEREQAEREEEARRRQDIARDELQRRRILEQRRRETGGRMRGGTELPRLEVRPEPTNEPEAAPLPTEPDVRGPGGRAM